MKPKSGTMLALKANPSRFGPCHFRHFFFFFFLVSHLCLGRCVALNDFLGDSFRYRVVPTQMRGWMDGKKRKIHTLRKHAHVIYRDFLSCKN